MAGRNVNLTYDLAAFVDEQVHNGRHQNASKVVREALRRYEGHLAAENEHIASIRAVIREGRDAISRGEFSLIATQADSEALFSRLTQRGVEPDLSRKPHYTLEELLEGSDYSEPEPPEEREWLDAPAVAREII